MYIQEARCVLDPATYKQDCTSIDTRACGAVQSLGILFSTEILRHHGVDHSFGPLCLSTQLLTLEGLEYLLTQYISAGYGVLQ